MIPFHLCFDLKTIQLYLTDAVLGMGLKIEPSLQFSVTRMHALHAHNIYLIMLQLFTSLLTMFHIFALYNPKTRIVDHLDGICRLK